MYTGSAQPGAPGAVAGRALSPTRTTTTFVGRNAACGSVPVGEGVVLGVGVPDAVWDAVAEREAVPDADRVAGGVTERLPVADVVPVPDSEPVGEMDG
jgi:hypothetical protein